MLASACIMILRSDPKKTLFASIKTCYSTHNSRGFISNYSDSNWSLGTSFTNFQFLYFHEKVVALRDVFCSERRLVTSRKTIEIK